MDGRGPFADVKVLSEGANGDRANVLHRDALPSYLNHKPKVLPSVSNPIIIILSFRNYWWRELDIRRPSGPVPGREGGSLAQRGIIRSQLKAMDLER